MWPGLRIVAEPEVADLHHAVVGDHEVVAGSIDGVGVGDPDVDAGVAQGGDRLDVVPMPVGGEHTADPRCLATSSSNSCSLAASMMSASPVLVQRTTNTLFSTGPTTSLLMQTSVVS